MFSPASRMGLAGKSGAPLAVRAPYAEFKLD